MVLVCNVRVCVCVRVGGWVGGWVGGCRCVSVSVCVCEPVWPKHHRFF